jgi:hypothetical protein
MTEAELRTELASLGIPADRWRLVALLPLVQVAWADERVQRAEREIILTIANQHGVLGGEGSEILNGWLTTPPSADLLRRARRLLVALVERHRGLGSDAPMGLISELREQCEEVAEAAGGLLGLVWTIDPREAAALDEIRRALSLPASLAPYSDDLPRPPGGWSDLE